MSEPLDDKGREPAAEPVGGQAESVTIAIARDPALVRTVRLVAAAVARRAAVHEAMIEEIRLAVGEACAVMIGIEEADVEAGADPNEQVVVRLTLEDSMDAAIEGRVADLSIDLAGLDLNPWALLQGLSDELTVRDEEGRTTVSMSWPIAAPVA